MRPVIYSLGISLDGFVIDPHSEIDNTAPTPEVFRFSIDEIRGVDVHLMGRKLYDTMLYWETAEEEHDLDDDHLVWTSLWNPLPKVVFSSTLTEVIGSARVATDDLATEIGRLKAEPGSGAIAIGGATLARQAADLDLIDEYRPRVHPVLLGGGDPFFTHAGRLRNLELVSTRTFETSPVIALRYRVRR